VTIRTRVVVPVVATVATVVITGLRAPTAVPVTAVIIAGLSVMTRGVAWLHTPPTVIVGLRPPTAVPVTAMVIASLRVSAGRVDWPHGVSAVVQEGGDCGQSDRDALGE